MRQLKRVKVASLKARKQGQARKTFLEPELRALGESLKVRQINPVFCDLEGYIIAGERRWRAAVLVGLEELDAWITDEELTETAIQIIQLTENLHRSDLKPCEKWMGCVELLKLNPTWQHKDLAAHLKLDAGMITKLLSPSKCIQAIQEAFIAGFFGISDCYAASRVDEQEQHEMLAAKLNGASRDELQQRVNVQRMSTTRTVKRGSSSRAARFTIRLPSGVTFSLKGHELSLDSIIEAASELLREAKRAREQKQSASTWIRVMADKASGTVSAQA